MINPVLDLDCFIDGVHEEHAVMSSCRMIQRSYATMVTSQDRNRALVTFCNVAHEFVPFYMIFGILFVAKALK
ncbi:hypothetical protein NKJ06_14985 [Mesorhizobium sp. M0293]|uniref:hypothetical protein n=1 Tax=Mesorhizobium sp. M0293 TaxID=2956930 RepID=UPI003337E9D3